MNETTKFELGAWLIFAVACAVVLCLGLGGCNEEVCWPTAWLMTGSDLDSQTNEIAGRLGIGNKDGVEFGAGTQWSGIKGAGQSYLVYAIQEFSLAPVPGSQYLGGQAGFIDVDEEGNIYGFIAGEKIPITANISSAIEGQFLSLDGALAKRAGTDDDWRLFAGMTIKY